MTTISRRGALGLAAAAATLPMPALGQADSRPTITVAVQNITTSNTLEMLYSVMILKCSGKLSNVSQQPIQTTIDSMLSDSVKKSILSRAILPFLATILGSQDISGLQLDARLAEIFLAGNFGILSKTIMNFSASLSQSCDTGILQVCSLDTYSPSTLPRILH
jgi:hypothetical protein